jgi:membrane protein DedA with SNARE-associated domain
VRKNLFLSLFVIKFTPYVQPIGLMFIGKTHIKYWRYGWYSIILCIPTPLVFGMAWYHLWWVNALLQNTHNEHLILGLIWAATVILICAVVGYYLIKKSKKILNRHLWEKI